jgi:hypothetical protein
MEARQMVCKGMVGREWDDMLCDLGIPLKTVLEIRRKLLKLCMTGVCEIWSEFCRIAGKRRVERALLGSTDMRETLEAAIEAHKFQLWKQLKKWAGEAKLRRKDPGAQIRWAKRMLQCSREQYQARAAGCGVETARLKMLDGMSNSLRGWLGIGRRGELAQDAQTWRRGTEERVRNSTGRFLTLLRKETTDGANLENDLLDEDDFVNAGARYGKGSDDDRGGSEQRGGGDDEDASDSDSSGDGGPPGGGGVLEGENRGGERREGNRSGDTQMADEAEGRRTEYPGAIQGDATLCAALQDNESENRGDYGTADGGLVVGLGENGATGGAHDMLSE